ncbi:MAG: hypothetical protein ACREXW_10770 [Gammaproteobacteria bacterium]
MDVLQVILTVVAGSLLIGVVIFLTWVLLFFLRMLLPLALGIAAGIWLWKSGHDNWGIAVGIIGIVLNNSVLWSESPIAKLIDWLIDFPINIGLPKGGADSYSSWKDNKNAIYDKNGNVTGYVDKE